MHQFIIFVWHCATKINWIEEVLLFTTLQYYFVWCMLPYSILTIFIHFNTMHMFFYQVCGSPDIPLYLLKSVATYKGVDATAPLLIWFWEVMEELSDNERSLFLRFVWGRTRLPRSIADFRGRDFVLQVCTFYIAKFDHLFLFNSKSKHFYTSMKRIWKQN